MLSFHTFARAKWSQQPNGNWRSAGGRVLSNDSYQRMMSRVEQAKGKKPGGNSPGANPVSPTPPTSPKPTPSTALKPAATTATAPRPQLQPPKADPTPIQPATSPKGAPPLPPTTPEQSKFINENYEKDKVRFGGKVAEFLRKTLATTVGMATAMNGFAWGALAGTALAGPLGLALGTFLGGGFGARAGAWAGKKVDKALSGRGRGLAMARGVARKIAPYAPAAAGLGAGLAAGIGGGILGTVAGPVGSTIGAVSGAAAGPIVYDAVKGQLSKSRVNNRRMARAGRQFFAEGESAPPNLDPVKLIRARLKALFVKQGINKEPDDSQIMAALAMVAKDLENSEQQAKLVAMSERRLLTIRRLTNS